VAFFAFVVVDHKGVHVPNPRSEAKAEAVESASPRPSTEADKRLGGRASKK
jgi:hypothetical protein